MREQDYYVQIEMMCDPLQVGDEIRIDVAMKCPGCESMLWARVQFRFSSLYEFVMFVPLRQCSCCLKRFDDAEGLLPYDKQFTEWMKLARLYMRRELEVSRKDIEESWHEMTHPYILPGSRQAEKRSKKRKKALYVKMRGEFYES